MTKITLRPGLACDVEDGPWRFSVGMTEKYGGQNTGPNPGVYGRAALGSCLAIGYGMWAARLEIPVRSLTVEVRARYDVARRARDRRARSGRATPTSCMSSPSRLTPRTPTSTACSTPRTVTARGSTTSAIRCPCRAKCTSSAASPPDVDARLQRRVQRYGWNKAAAYYDGFWSEQLRPAQDLMLALAALRPGERVLDIACGTGLVTFRAADAVGPAGSSRPRTSRKTWWRRSPRRLRPAVSPVTSAGWTPRRSTTPMPGSTPCSARSG